MGCAIQNIFKEIMYFKTNSKRDK